MQKVDISTIDYLGADIVNDLIESNKKYDSKKINFEKLDIIKDDLPKCDLIFCRDCLVHFSNEDLIKAINNILKSNSKFLMTTYFVKRRFNKKFRQECGDLLI